MLNNNILIDAVNVSEIFAASCSPVYQYERRHIPEDGNTYHDRCTKLKPCHAKPVTHGTVVLRSKVIYMFSCVNSWAQFAVLTCWFVVLFTEESFLCLFNPATA